MCERLGNSSLYPGMGFAWPSRPATPSKQSRPPARRERTDSDGEIQKASDLISAADGRPKSLDTGQFEARPLTAPQIQSASQLQTIIGAWHRSC